jgi:hypothetical protein
LTYNKDSNIGTEICGGILMYLSDIRYPTWLSGSVRICDNLSGFFWQHALHLSTNIDLSCFTHSKFYNKYEISECWHLWNIWYLYCLVTPMSQLSVFMYAFVLFVNNRWSFMSGLNIYHSLCFILFFFFLTFYKFDLTYRRCSKFKRNLWRASFTTLIS